MKKNICRQELFDMSKTDIYKLLEMLSSDNLLGDIEKTYALEYVGWIIEKAIAVISKNMDSKSSIVREGAYIAWSELCNPAPRMKQIEDESLKDMVKGIIEDFELSKNNTNFDDPNKIDLDKRFEMMEKW